MIEVLTNQKDPIMKNLKMLKGINVLTKNEQKKIMGGDAPICEEGNIPKRCPRVGSVPAFWICVPYSSPDDCI